MKPYTIISEKVLPESELKIEVEINYETVAKHRASALKKISATISVPGFRAGHVPENIVIQKIGEFAVLEEAAYASIEENLIAILKEKNLSIVGEPHVAITKLAKDNPLTFDVTVSIIPEVKLPDYKKIASAENAKPAEEISVTEKEVEDIISSIQKSFATGQTSAGKDETKPEEKIALPEFNDEFVKRLGDFKDVADFKIKVRENLRQEKNHKAKEKKRIIIAESILKKTDVVAPKALIEMEIAKMLARFQDDVARMGLKMEDYLKHVKKTEEEMRKEWRPDAEKRAKLQIVLDSIVREEKIEADAGAVEEEVKHILEYHKDADPARAKAYISTMLTNEKVFEFLETQK